MGLFQYPVHEWELEDVRQILDMQGEERLEALSKVKLHAVNAEFANNAECTEPNLFQVRKLAQLMKEKLQLVLEEKNNDLIIEEAVKKAEKHVNDIFKSRRQKDKVFTLKGKNENSWLSDDRIFVYGDDSSKNKNLDAAVNGLKDANLQVIKTESELLTKLIDTTLEPAPGINFIQKIKNKFSDLAST